MSCAPCLRCSEYAATIQRFVETRRAYEWGLVCQALAGAMRHVLQVRVRVQGSKATATRLGSWRSSAGKLHAMHVPAMYCIHVSVPAVPAGLGADGGPAGAPAAQRQAHPAGAVVLCAAAAVRCGGGTGDGTWQCSMVSQCSLNS